MHCVCTYTSGFFFIYDNEYRRVHYDNDHHHHHVSHDTHGSADLQTSLRTTISTMMGLGGANRLEIHACTCGSCVGKYYTSNFVRTGGHPYDGFNDRFLTMSYICVAFPNPNGRVTYLLSLS